MKKCLFLLFLFFSTNSFSQWINQTLPDSLRVTLGIDFIDQNNGITGGWYINDLFFEPLVGREFYTSDGGQNWFLSSTPDSLRTFVEVQMINNTLCYGAGAYNLQNTTSNIKRTTIKDFLSTKTFSDLKNLRLGIGMYEDEPYRGYFLESTNCGISWHPKGSFDDSVHYLTAMSFYDQDTGVVIAISSSPTTNSILKTTNGGMSWNYIYPFAENIKLEKAKMVTASTIVAVGESNDSGIVLISNDGGNSWHTKVLPEFTWITGIACLDSLNFIISANSLSSAGIYRSTDGAENWEELKSYFSPPQLINGINFLKNSGLMLAFGALITSGGSIYGSFIDVSLDGGNNWNYSEVLVPYLTVYSKIIDNRTWYLAGTNTAIFDGIVLYTPNGSDLPVELVSFTANSTSNSIILNWETASELNNNGFEIQKLINEDFITIGFVQGNGTTSESHSYSYSENNLNPDKYSYRLKQIDFDGSFEYSNIIEINLFTPYKFELSQNYPNPFNPTTKIKFQLAEAANTMVKIYDALGNEVATLINEFKPAGNYEVDFNANNLTSGVYLYKIEAGNFSQTRKMLLMK